jgi:hypothetical protein
VNERHGQSEHDAATWLHWIEEATEGDVRAHFADDPAAMNRVLAWRRDRAVLSHLQEPAAPPELLAAAIAETTSPLEFAAPGAARRTRRRDQMWRSLPRTASIAAAVLLCLGAAWFAIDGLIDRLGRVTIPESVPAVVHVDVPETPQAQPVRPFYDLAAAVANRGSSEETPQVSPRTATPIIEAPFAIVLNVADQVAAERAICAVSQSLQNDATVVRNLTMSEVEHLQNQTLASWRRNPRQSDPLVASDTPLSRGVAPDQLRGSGGPVPHISSAPAMPSGVLAGPRAAAPSFQAQLRTSGFGGEVTVVLRARDLSALLAGLSLFDDTVALARLSGRPGAAISLQEAITHLALEGHDEVIVHLPVLRPVAADRH